MSETLNYANENQYYEEWSNLGGESRTNIDDEWDSLKNYEQEEADTLPSPEEKINELSFESLSNLSTEEYLELWKTLNPFYTTHVTRQGIRDHNFMMEHSGGIGAFHDSFKAILKDNKELCSPAEATYNLPANFTEDDVAEVLEECVFSSNKYDGLTPEQIIDTLPMNMRGFSSSDPWCNRNAIHMAQHTVLDQIYGGENNNEVFFVFPTDVIASQCRFGGSMHQGLNTAQVVRERQWNDMFVWPESGRIPVDAGLVFLPKNQIVDRETGSKYATEEVQDEQGNIAIVPKIDEERIDRFKQWLKSFSEESPEAIAIEKDGDSEPIRRTLTEIGIPQECLDGMVEYDNIIDLFNLAKGESFILLNPEEEELPYDERLDLLAHRYLLRKNANLKDTENPITAEEYWENYFKEHPEQKPAHIVYYDGNPSEAVKEFLKEQNIIEEIDDGNYYREEVLKENDHEQQITGPGDTVERDGRMLGFESHFVRDMSEDEKMQSEHQRFNEIALAILQQVK